MLDELIKYRDPQEKEISAVIKITDKKGKNTSLAKGNLNGRDFEHLTDFRNPAIEIASNRLKGKS